MQRHNILVFLCFLTGFFSFEASADTSIDEDKTSAVILAYHRIGEEQHSDTNLRIDQFEEHLRAFKSARYSVLPLSVIIESIQNGTTLPERTLAITFEGGYKSAYEHAIPHLIENEIPFTIFFASNHADADLTQHMNWQDIQSLSKEEYASFGLHPASYIRLAEQKKQDILSQINKARVRFREKLNQEPVFFSYPFGEYSSEYKNLIKDQGFKAAFGQHSGTISASSDIHALPRFTMTERYGSMERFELVSNALPLPVSDIEPADPYLKAPQSQLGFTVAPNLSDQLSALSCYVSGQDQPSIEILSANRVELKFQEPTSDPRTRINCTLPGPSQKAGDPPKWRWFSRLLVQGDLTETAEAN